MELTIPIEDPSRRGALFGTGDRNLRVIRAAFGIRISARDGVIHISGSDDEVRLAAQVVDSLQRALRSSPDVSDEVLDATIEQAKIEAEHPEGARIDVYPKSSAIAPRGDGQRRYVAAMRENDLTLCSGPAGSGKTYLAVAVAVSLLKRQQIKRIVLVRPAVEAGEKLGYLPGDLQAKVNPYLRPLFDAMNDMMSFEQLRRFMENDVVEVVPLAFMRGRTLNDSVIILDEAQNATVSQMLMFLTRLGRRSKMIVTGDVGQSDLAEGELSGLGDAVERLIGTEGVGVVELSGVDIVRHPLVQRIVSAYGRGDG